MESTHSLDIGICCFCGFECNPMSQSCGSCARGISGAAIGIPVPSHLRKFVYGHEETKKKKDEKDPKKEEKKKEKDPKK